MKCEQARKHLSAYLDDRLEQDLRVRLEDHLSRCERCNKELSELRNVIESMSSLDRIKAPPDFLDDVKKRLAPGFSLSKILKTMFLPLQIKIPIQATAVAVSLLLVFALVQQLQRSTDEFPQPLPQKAMKKRELSEKETLEEPKRSKSSFGLQEGRKVRETSYQKESAVETDSDKGITETQRSIKVPDMANEDVLPGQPVPEKEGSQHDLALKPGDSKKRHQETGLRAGLESRLEPEPIELVVFIGQAGQSLTQAETRERDDETSASGIAEKEEAPTALGRPSNGSGMKEKSASTDHGRDQDRSSIETVSELATAGTLARIQQMVFEFNGKVITTVQSDQPTIPSLIKTEIPAPSYEKFCSKLKTLSPRTNCSAVAGPPDQTMIPVNINIYQK